MLNWKFQVTWFDYVYISHSHTLIIFIVVFDQGDHVKGKYKNTEWGTQKQPLFLRKKNGVSYWDKIGQLKLNLK